ncbi:hypothetical protein GGF46_005293 [Coemansia sp. RSA 552]|nr:hypothetical protein GGF46_005293 [Coemansia sp. RSA 552]
MELLGDCRTLISRVQVEEAMKARAADDETKEEMRRIFQRYQDQIAEDDLDMASKDAIDSETDSDEDVGASLAERLGGVDLEADESGIADAIWGRLTQEERDEFANLSLTRKVHPSVLFQLAQISLAYVYMMRHLNGEPHEDNLGAAFSDLVTVSPLLVGKTTDVYESSHEALVVGLCNIDADMGNGAKCALLDDLLALYSDASYIAAMLSDIHNMATELLTAKTSVRGDIKRLHVKYAEKRVFFLLSVVRQMQQSSDPWQFMSADLAMLRRRYSSETEALTNNKKVGAAESSPTLRLPQS